MRIVVVGIVITLVQVIQGMRDFCDIWFMKWRGRRKTLTAFETGLFAGEEEQPLHGLDDLYFDFDFDLPTVHDLLLDALLLLRRELHDGVSPQVVVRPRPLLNRSLGHRRLRVLVTPMTTA